MKMKGMCLRCKRMFENDIKSNDKVFFFNCEQHKEG